MNGEQLKEAIRENWWQASLIVLGSLLMVGGIILAERETETEQLIVTKQTATETTGEISKEIVVDVAGAVEHPGLLRLPLGSRVGEVIVAAGGLSAKANRSWVARFVNQAEVARDGSKIYIPELGESQEQEATSVVVSVNTASLSELDGLWGVGAARAQAIIDNRPYGTLTELITKAKLTQAILDKNQGKIGL